MKIKIFTIILILGKTFLSLYSEETKPVDISSPAQEQISSVAVLPADSEKKDAGLLNTGVSATSILNPSGSELNNTTLASVNGPVIKNDEPNSASQGNNSQNFGNEAVQQTAEINGKVSTETVSINPTTPDVSSLPKPTSEVEKKDDSNGKAL